MPRENENNECMVGSMDVPDPQVLRIMRLVGDWVHARAAEVYSIWVGIGRLLGAQGALFKLATLTHYLDSCINGHSKSPVAPMWW